MANRIHQESACTTTQTSGAQLFRVPLNVPFDVYIENLENGDITMLGMTQYYPDEGVEGVLFFTADLLTRLHARHIGIAMTYRGEHNLSVRVGYNGVFPSDKGGLLMTKNQPGYVERAELQLNSPNDTIQPYVQEVSLGYTAPPPVSHDVQCTNVWLGCENGSGRLVFPPGPTTVAIMKNGTPPLLPSSISLSKHI
ncbi:hypothetical protein K474DRAFT_1676325 [Panus rudis PR-1116 ss-1]|nr:hypothetical protein K474DRAFT_1676325 [Panus rudis PR-1116 ss-1]